MLQDEKDLLNLEVTTHDLNSVDALNGSGAVSQRDAVTSSNLKGSLNPIYKAYYDKSFKHKDELQFVWNMRQIALEFLLECIDYEGLPDELDKYKIDRKLHENGKVAIIKFKGKFFAVNFSVQTFDIYMLPDIIIVTEPKSDAINGKTFSVVDGEAAILRANIYNLPYTNSINIWVESMEKCLYQIRKNLVAAAPKGILIKDNINFANESSSDLKIGMESVVNGEDTFYEMIPNDDITGRERIDLFTPIELTDRTDKLWENYYNLKEQFKEFLGATNLGGVQKKERLISAETDNNQDLAAARFNHMVEIRKIDVKVLNKVFNLNVSVIENIENYDEGETDENATMKPDKAND